MSNHGKRRLHFGFNYGLGGNFLRHRLPGTSPDSKVNFLTPFNLIIFFPEPPACQKQVSGSGFRI
jgi:hypothetical protein